MSEQRETGDALVRPITYGILIGGVLTALLGFGLGLDNRLIAPMAGQGFVRSMEEWSFLFIFSVLIGGIFQWGVLKLTSILMPFPLSLRLSFASLVAVGVFFGAAAIIASCLMIDLKPHLELPFRKGPDIPFPKYVLAIYIVIPLLLVKRASARAKGSDIKEVA